MIRFFGEFTMALSSIFELPCKTSFSFTWELPCLYSPVSDELLLKNFYKPYQDDYLPERCKPSLQTSFSIILALSIYSKFGVRLHILQIEILKSLIRCSTWNFMVRQLLGIMYNHLYLKQNKQNCSIIESLYK